MVTISSVDNVALLLKDKLNFEIMVRGSSPISDVIGLRSPLRELIRTGAKKEWMSSRSWQNIGLKSMNGNLC